MNLDGPYFWKISSQLFFNNIIHKNSNKLFLDIEPESHIVTLKEAREGR